MIWEPSLNIEVKNVEIIFTEAGIRRTTVAVSILDVTQKLLRTIGLEEHLKVELYRKEFDFLTKDVVCN